MLKKPKYNNMKIAVRIDDIAPTMKWKNFYKIINLLNQFNIRPLLGVVPHNEHSALIKDKINLNFWKDIKDFQKNGYVIALHGYNHLYSKKKKGIFPVNSFSEFAGESYSVQYRKIFRGMKIFEKHGIETNIFMAPGHTFDLNTLRVLRNLNFKYISDGYEFSPYNKKINDLTFLPIEYSRSAWGGGGRENNKFRCVTIVLHPNSMTIIDIEDFKRFLIKHKDSLINYEELYHIPINQQSYAGAIREYIYALSQNIKIKVRKFKKRGYKS